MRRLLRRGMLMTVAGMAWKNREAIQRAVRSQGQRRSAGTVRR